MSLKAYSAETLFTFTPTAEKEAKEEFEKKNPGQTYLPLTILHVQMDGEMAAAYRSRLSNFMKTAQEISGRGSQQKIMNKTEVDFGSVRKLDLDTARSVIRRATGFENIVAKGLPHTYPIVKGGKVEEEWCSDAEVLAKVLEAMDEDWLSEFINATRSISELTPYEKKS